MSHLNHKTQVGEVKKMSFEGVSHSVDGTAKSGLPKKGPGMSDPNKGKPIRGKNPNVGGGSKQAYPQGHSA